MVAEAAPTPTLAEAVMEEEAAPGLEVMVGSLGVVEDAEEDAEVAEVVEAVEDGRLTAGLLAGGRPTADSAGPAPTTLPPDSDRLALEDEDVVRAVGPVRVAAAAAAVVGEDPVVLELIGLGLNPGPSSALLASTGLVSVVAPPLTALPTPNVPGRAAAAGSDRRATADLTPGPSAPPALRL